MAKLEQQNNQKIRGVTHEFRDERQETGRIIQKVEERKEAYVQEASKNKQDHEKDNPKDIN